MKKNIENISPLTYTISQAARTIQTTDTNIRVLIDLGYIRPLKLGSLKIYDGELTFFLEKYSGVDLNYIIKNRIPANTAS